MYRGRLPKKGGGGAAWTVCWFLRGTWQERGGGVFEGGVNAHYDYFVPFRVIENRFRKIKFKYFNGSGDYSSWLG